MPRPELRPPPSRVELAELPVHVVARDFPETLAVLLRLGVAVPDRGGHPVAAALDGDTGPLLDALVATIAWRAPAPG